MKKYIYLFAIIFIFFQTNLFSQAVTCPEENIIITNQTQLNEFVATYGNCATGKMVGSLSISGSTIRDISGLNFLKKITGNLDIRRAANLVSLTGLENLQSVEGEVVIRYNYNLTSITGLSGLQTVGQDLEIRDNNTLTTIDGIQQIQSVGRDLVISGNNVLTECSLVCPLINDNRVIRNTYIANPLAPCTSTLASTIFCLPDNSCPQKDYVLTNQNDVNAFVDKFKNCAKENMVGNLNISGSTIRDISGLSFLKSITGNLKVRNTTNLASLTGLENLQSVEGEVVIRFNHNLTSITDLSELQTVGLNLEIRDNNILTTLDGIQQVQSVGWDLIISDNDVLMECTIACPLINENRVVRNISINNPLAPCNTFTDFTAFCGTQDTIPPLTAVLDIIQLAECQNNCDGIVKAFPTGGTAPYTYFWRGGFEEKQLTNVCAEDRFSVTITDAKGEFIELSGVMPAGQLPPTADFSFQANGLEVNFTDLSKPATDTWLWNFGDTNSSTEQNPTHIYAQAGNYTISQFTSNECGADTILRDVTITVPTENVITFEFGEATSSSGAVVSIPVTVANFNAIGGFQYSIHIEDTTKACFAGVNSFNLTGLTNANFFIKNGVINCIWLDNNLEGIILPNETVIFDIQIALKETENACTGIVLRAEPTDALVIQMVDNETVNIPFQSIAGEVCINNSFFFSDNIHQAGRTPMPWIIGDDIETSNIDSGDYIAKALYNEMVSIEEGKSGDLFVKKMGKAYPNPMRDNLMVAFELTEAKMISLSISSLSGQQSIIYLQKEAYQQGQHEIMLNTSQLSAGIYLMQFQTKDALWIEKLVKM